MTIIRSTSHVLKYQTCSKSKYLKQMFEDYQINLNIYIQMILKEQLPLKQNLSSKDLPTITTEHSAWKQIVYKTASEIIRSQIKKANSKRYKRYKQLYYLASKTQRRQLFLNKKFSELNLKNILKTKYFSIPNLKNFSMTLDSRLINFSNDSKYFDEFIKISTTVRDEKFKRKFVPICLPIKHYKHSLKYKNDEWTRKNSIRIRKVNDQYFLDLIYEKEEPKRKTIGNIIAFDQGYKKLISDSNGNHYGIEMFNLYQKISRKQQGSKAFKRLLIHRDNEINRIINNIKDLDNVKELIIEDLKYVKHKTKLFKTVMNKVQRWSYVKTTSKLERFCQENGVLLTKINPAYTSQTCSNCGVVDKSNRKGELFCCSTCKMEIDADYNAAINILHIGECDPYDSKKMLAL